MPKININHGKFEQWANTIDTKNTELLDTLKNINTNIKSLAGDWESNSAVSIREKIDGMVPKFEQYYEVVKKYSDFLRSTASEYKTMEEGIDSQAKQFI